MTRMREKGKQAIDYSASQMKAAANRLGESFDKTVATLLGNGGKCIVCGIGKSGAIAQKLTATLCSTGTRAVFLHAAEAVHGDLGVYTPGDPVILISKSGATPEMVRLLPWFREKGSEIIAIVGNLNSPIAEQADHVLDASVEREADPLNLAPTASSTVALAIGDALAVCLMEARQFSAERFAENHPGGQLGRNLSLKVKDVMHGLDKIAIVEATNTFRELIIAMSDHNLGAACVLDKEHALTGLVTDGDIRRALVTHREMDGLTVADVMTPSPLSIEPNATLREAIDKMENRPSQISVLPVTDGKQCLGLIRIHDIYHG